MWKPIVLPCGPFPTAEQTRCPILVTYASMLDPGPRTYEPATLHIQLHCTASTTGAFEDWAVAVWHCHRHSLQYHSRCVGPGGSVLVVAVTVVQRCGYSRKRNSESCHSHHSAKEGGCCWLLNQFVSYCVIHGCLQIVHIRIVYVLFKIVRDHIFTVFYGRVLPFLRRTHLVPFERRAALDSPTISFFVEPQGLRFRD